MTQVMFPKYRAQDIAGQAPAQAAQTSSAPAPGFF